MSKGGFMRRSANFKTIKKPTTGFEAEMGSGYRRTKLERNRPAPTPSRAAPPPGGEPPSGEIDAYGRHALKYRLPVRAASRSLEVFLEFTRKLDESRCHANVFIDRIALIVAGNDFRTPFVRHGGGNLIEACAQQIADDRFDRLPGKQCRQGMQARGIVQIEANRIFLHRPHRRRVFLPAIE